MKIKRSKQTGQGPSSAIGIMKFNDSMKGIKLSPRTVVILSVIFIIIILMIKIGFRY